MMTRPMHAAAPVLCLLVLASLAAGCTSPTSAGSAGAQSCSGTVTVDEHANGTTVQLCAGQQLSVQLHSTYWQGVASNEPAILHRTAPTSVTPAPTPGFPGVGCGTLITGFQGIAAGTATVSAHRTTCGEALLCRPSQRDFSVTIVVS
jgi:hypothetical protein